jgi:hypothetical protein
MSSPRVLVMAGVLVAIACGDKPDDAEAGDTSATMATGGSDTQTTGEPTGPTSAPTTTTGGTTAGVDDMCGSRPSGDWNACFQDGTIMNSLCGWTMGDGAGSVTCLSPASGGFNSCGIRDCVDDCDCFAPPATGTAIPFCLDIFVDGGKGCVLYCVNGQICPDGMECVSGTCYWPN